MKSIEVIIETTAGSAVKYNYDRGASVFKVKKVLPLGMVFPYHFGFIPNTIGDDGGALDAMIISEHGSFSGAHLNCRLIGALMASQKEKGKKSLRNDRFFFISVDSLLYEHIKTINDFGVKHNHQLKQFFINYNKAEDKIFTPIKVIGPAQAVPLINSSTSATNPGILRILKPK